MLVLFVCLFLFCLASLFFFFYLFTLTWPQCKMTPHFYQKLNSRWTLINWLLKKQEVWFHRTRLSNLFLYELVFGFLPLHDGIWHDHDLYYPYIDENGSFWRRHIDYWSRSKRLSRRKNLFSLRPSRSLGGEIHGTGCCYKQWLVIRLD